MFSGHNTWQLNSTFWRLGKSESNFLVTCKKWIQLFRELWKLKSTNKNSVPTFWRLRRSLSSRESVKKTSNRIFCFVGCFQHSQVAKKLNSLLQVARKLSVFTSREKLNLSIIECTKRNDLLFNKSLLNHYKLGNYYE